MTCDQINVAGHQFAGITMKLQNASLLVIKATHGFLACGYINLDSCTKFNDTAAIVSGVSDYNSMLEAKIKAVTPEAEAKGIRCGISGREALILMD